MDKIIERFKEPSSYAALSGVLAMAGVIIPNDLWQNVALIGCGLCGAVGFFKGEKTHGIRYEWRFVRYYR